MLDRFERQTTTATVQDFEAAPRFKRKVTTTTRGSLLTKRPRRAHSSNCSIATVLSTPGLARKQESAASPSMSAMSLVSDRTRFESSTARSRSTASEKPRMNLGLLLTNATRLALPCCATVQSTSIQASNTSGKIRRISPPDSITCSAPPPPRSRKSIVRSSSRRASSRSRFASAVGIAAHASAAIPPARTAKPEARTMALFHTAWSVK